MIAELSARLPPDAPPSLRSIDESILRPKGRERASALADLVRPGRGRARFAGRRIRRRSAPNSACRPRGAGRAWLRSRTCAAFSPPSQLQADASRFFLREAWRRAREVLGAPEGSKLGELGRWLDKGWDGGRSLSLLRGQKTERRSPPPRPVRAGSTDGSNRVWGDAPTRSTKAPISIRRVDTARSTNFPSCSG